ncbi:MAG TPA: hypothetical protein VK002_02545 [Rubricoccaceae bacterium]|nr:hypothetical protein [Rubricoccaceae bacterium]
MAAASSSKLLNRANGVLGFFVGIFGALAILGVFFKIAKLPNYELFMTIGFFGEAATFVLMGFFALIGGFTAKAVASAEEADYAPAIPPPPQVDLEALGEAFREELRQATAAFREELRERLHARFAADFDTAAEAMTRDVTALGAEMRGLGQEMQRARASVHTLRDQIDNAATARLAEDAATLAGEMHFLCGEVSAAGASAQRMRSDLEMMAERFHGFNHAGGGQGRGNGHAPQAAWVAGGDRNEHSEVAR